MNIYDDDRCSINIIDWDVWDVDNSGVTGQWKMDQFGNMQIQCWYEWESTKYLFWKYKKRYFTWIEEGDFTIIDKYDSKIPIWKHFHNGVEI